MRTIRKTGIALTLAIGMGSAMAADTHVGQGETKTFGPTDTIKNLIIEGGTVELNGTYVQGHIKVSDGGELTAKGAMIVGDIKGKDAALISILDGTYAYRNVEVSDSTGVFEIYASSISGGVKLKNNDFEWIDIYLSDIYNKLEINKNTLYDWVVVERIYQGGDQKLEDNEAFGILITDNGTFEDVEVRHNYTDAETAIEYNLHEEDTAVEGNEANGLIFSLNEVLRDVDLEKNFSIDPIEVNENWALYGYVKIKKNTAPSISANTNLIGNDLELVDNRASEVISVIENTLDSHLILKDNRGAGGIDILKNVIDDNLELKGNRTTGAIVVADNTAGDDFKCKGNRPAPLLSGNTIDGDNECE